MIYSHAAYNLHLIRNVKQRQAGVNYDHTKNQ